VALERQSIEKKDFPIGRRGYDPEAVDAHLSAVAQEVEELKRSARRRTETLASSASDQVRAIVEAAENTAADIQRQAEDDAREIRGDATAEAQATREQATGQARDYVGKVSESTAVMLQRLDAMESELGALIDALRTGSHRLNADLQLLEGNLVELGDAAALRPQFEPEGGAPYAEEPAPQDKTPTWGDEPPVAEEQVYSEQAADTAYETEAAYETQEVYADEEPAPAEHTTVVHEAVEPAAGAPAGGGDEDAEGARLIALNMALNGTPREETDRYLAANFTLADRGGLLDEVYASVEG
jgi:DivIVA domain-containing protein